MSEARIETADLTVDEIMAAVESAKALARERFGEHIDAKSLDLRLWAAAALIDSACAVSIRSRIMRSLGEKLAFIEASRRNDVP
jgi:hypothetical protein